MLIYERYPELPVIQHSVAICLDCQEKHDAAVEQTQSTKETAAYEKVRVSLFTLIQLSEKGILSRIHRRVELNVVENKVYSVVPKCKSYLVPFT